MHILTNPGEITVKLSCSLASFLGLGRAAENQIQGPQKEETNETTLFNHPYTYMLVAEVLTDYI